MQVLYVQSKISEMKDLLFNNKFGIFDVSETWLNGNIY